MKDSVYNQIQETINNLYNLVINYNQKLIPIYASISEENYNGEPLNDLGNVLLMGDSRDKAKLKKREALVKSSKKGNKKCIITKNGKKIIQRKRNGSR